jgi:hypothetical protein
MTPLHIHRREEMKEVTAKELYEMLDKLGVYFEVAEMFEGIRVINFPVKEEDEDENK